MEQTTETLTVQKSPIALSRNGLQLQSLDDLWRFSQCVVKSGFAPKGLEKTESVLIAVEMGFEVGLSPMAALQNTAVVNGRPTIYGDAALALVRSSGLLERYEERQVGTRGKDDWGYCVTVKRKGDPSEYSDTFTVADAKAANLWGKSAPWSQYPARMLKFRARGFILRDAFGDVLKGMRTFEEVRDSVDADFEVVEDKPKQKLFKTKQATPAIAEDKSKDDGPENPTPETPTKRTAVAELIARLDAGQIYNAVADVGISPDEFVGACAVEMGKLTALYHDKRKIKNDKQTKKASDLEVKNLLQDAGLLTYTQTAPTLKLAEGK